MEVTKTIKDIKNRYIHVNKDKDIIVRFKETDGARENGDKNWCGIV